MAEPIVRFRRDDGSSYPAWENGRFGDLIEVYDEKVTSDCTLPVLTSSKTDGIQYQSEHFGREQLHDITGYNVIPRGYCTYRNRSDGTDFTFNINNLCDRGIVSKFYPVFHATNRCNLYFLMTLLNNEPKTVRKIAATAKGTGQKVLSFLDLQKIEINIPCLEEQQRIADFLSSIDEVIGTSEAEVQNLETQKKVVMTKLFSQEVRFKGVDGKLFPEWKETTIRDCLDYEQPTKYIVRSDTYDDQFSTPVLTANKGFILGFTDEQDGHYDKGEVIIYDDFTMDMKYVTFEFKVKSSAMKMLTPKDSTVNLYFMYCLLCEKELHQESHSRSYISIVEPMEISIPCFEEQCIIADFLSDFDEAIASAKKELELWKKLKKGLLQKMFV